MSGSFRPFTSPRPRGSRGPRIPVANACGAVSSLIAPLSQSGATERGAAERFQLGVSLRCEVGDQQQGAGPFEPRPDALPACQGLLQRGAVTVLPAVGPGEAGGGPEVLLRGRGRCGEELAGVREVGDDCGLGGQRPGVGVVVPVLGCCHTRAVRRCRAR